MENEQTFSRKDLENFIIDWNIRFKWDRFWRKKYGIPFGSEKHLSISQVDIFLDCLEDRVIEKAHKDFLDKKKDLEEYQKSGKFLKEQVMSQQEEEELWKKIKLK